MIDDFIKLIPTSLMGESGSVFFSSRHSFRSKSDLYILGANPGGDSPPCLTFKDTIAGDICNFLHRHNEFYSPYRDQRWGKGGKYKPLQRGVLHLIKKVGQCPSEVPASEVVFQHSKDLTELGDFNSKAKLCWPFHKEVIRALEVRVVVCLGRDAGRFVRRKMNANKLVCKFVEKNNRKWNSYLHVNKEGIFVADLTHPAQAAWTTSSADPTHLVERALKESSRD